MELKEQSKVKMVRFTQPKHYSQEEDQAEAEQEEEGGKDENRVDDEEEDEDDEEEEEEEDLNVVLKKKRVVFKGTYPIDRPVPGRGRGRLGRSLKKRPEMTLTLKSPRTFLIDEPVRQMRPIPQIPLIPLIPKIPKIANVQAEVST